MKTFNKTLLATAVGMAMTSTAAQAEIELGKGLSVSGFVDMSFVYVDNDDDEESTQDFAVDQVETNFHYSGADGISARVDIEYGESGDDSGADETFVEEAFIQKQFNDQFSLKAGRFLSYTGWETEEPTGLYQYSGTGYGGVFYGGYQQGISAMYDGGMFQVMASAVNDAFNPTNSDNESIDIELGAAIMPIDGLTAKLFYIDAADDELINFWASFETGPFTLAFEYNTRENDDNSTAVFNADLGLGGYEDADSYLLMANYAVDAFGFTIRYHSWEAENVAFGAETVDVEGDAITLAPSYAVSDNLLLVAEYRMDDIEDDETDTFALEALFTF